MNFDRQTVDTYNWLRFRGMREVDIPKVLGGHRQYYHSLRKQNGSSEYEMVSIGAESHSFFDNY